MKRPGLRPTLDGMVSPGTSSSSPLGPTAGTAYSAGPAGGQPTTMSSATTLTGPGGRVLPRLSESWAGDKSQQQLRRGGAAPGALASMASPTQSTLSFLVSASGGMLTLGDHYHVSSSGVAEFRDDERTKALGLDAANHSGLTCRHVSELDFENGFQIGRGSSGKVYNVLHTPSGKRVCVKQMTIDDAHSRDEIKRELDTLHKAPSRWVVDFHGAFFHHDLGVILLVLELMDGSLRDLLNIRKRLDEREAKAFTLQAVNGLARLHSELSLIHRDVKPENLLFDRAGRVKVTDFGVSRGNRTADPNSVHTFVGSISYMSPERLEGKAYSYEVDVWSLGIAVCEMVTGYHPYQDTFGPGSAKLTFWDLLQKVVSSGAPGASDGPSPLEACLDRMAAAGLAPPDVSDDLIDFVAQCLAFDREDRASAERLLLHPWLAAMEVGESEEIAQQVAFEAARLKDQETRRLAAVGHQSGASPRTGSSGTTPAASSAAGTARGAAQAAQTPVMSTPEESKARSAAMMDDFVNATMGTAPRAPPNR